MLRFFLTWTFLSLFSISGMAASNKVTDSAHLNLVTCKLKDFVKFIEEYSDDIAIQKAAISYPLEKLYVVDLEPEPKLVTKQLAQNQVHFPIIPGKQVVEEQKLEKKIENTPDGNWKITFIKPDTDYHISYVFHRGPCWKLIKIEDWTL